MPELGKVQLLLAAAQAVADIQALHTCAVLHAVSTMTNAEY
jgi:hypothetical protein